MKRTTVKLLFFSSLAYLLPLFAPPSHAQDLTACITKLDEFISEIEGLVDVAQTPIISPPYVAGTSDSQVLPPMYRVMVNEIDYGYVFYVQNEYIPWDTYEIGLRRYDGLHYCSTYKYDNDFIIIDIAVGPLPAQSQYNRWYASFVRAFNYFNQLLRE